MPAPALDLFAVTNRALVGPMELDVVTLRTATASDDGETVPAGATGTIVAVYGDAAAFGVEFEKPIHALATIYPHQIGSYRRAGQVHPGFRESLEFVIPFPKLTHYLLHAEGAAPGKAKFFIGHGFHRDAPTELAQALWQHAKPEHHASVRVVPFGRNLVFAGPIRTPNGTGPSILSVWHVPNDNPQLIARFATAYPS